MRKKYTNELTDFYLLRSFVANVFKTDLTIFLKALKFSPGAQGYIMGAISEILVKELLKSKYTSKVYRIKEKWEGEKFHKGDFYFLHPNYNKWFTLEVKGVKSNSEKWHKLYNRKNLEKFLTKILVGFIMEGINVPWLKIEESLKKKGKEEIKKKVEIKVREWIDKELPKFKSEFSTDIYEYEEVQNYKPPKRPTQKSKIIEDLKRLSREEINKRIEERIKYVQSKVRVLETHFVSNASEKSGRSIATPRKDEVNVIALDIVLRYREHKFLFAIPKELEPSSANPMHLKQNYIVGLVFVENGVETLYLDKAWTCDFREILKKLKPEDAIKREDKMQIDTRYTKFRI